ncbi:unnamed protein product [Polarella glacialis]|uniref:Uncharacterized protein n=1 Tax=Polarella glacialis TaxID=89957 RepID=A0A813JWE9_POLGL|nr:unnamed protein product [Polarella glacialis]
MGGRASEKEKRETHPRKHKSKRKQDSNATNVNTNNCNNKNKHKQTTKQTNDKQLKQANKTKNELSFCDMHNRGPEHNDEDSGNKKLVHPGNRFASPFRK